MANDSRYIDGKDMWHNSPEFDEMMRTYLNTGDKSLLDKLTKAHLPLVIEVAGHYTGYLKSRGSLELNDLIQEGSIGLMRGIDHYDPNMKGRNFHAYAIWWIKQGILRAIADKNRTIRLPVNRTIELKRMSDEAEDYQKRYGRKPSLEQLSKIMNVPLEEIREISQYSEPGPLDSFYQDDNEEIREARAVDSNSGKETELVFRRDLLKRTLDKTTKLTAEERNLLYEKFGLNGYIGYLTDAKLGRIHGLTRERMRQKVAKAIKKVRNANAGQIQENQQNPEF